jgi:hypothetical protein
VFSGQLEAKMLLVADCLCTRLNALTQTAYFTISTSAPPVLVGTKLYIRDRKSILAEDLG